VERVKIVIVGAGASGIAAATKLLENGINDFVILEAQDYYGGRVNTVRFGDEYVDLGAQWIHGEEGNVVFKMAKPHNLIEKDEFKTTYLQSSGNVLDKEQINSILDILDEITESAYQDLHNYTDSLGNFFNQEYPKMLKKQSLQSSALTWEMFDWYQKDLNVEDSSDTWFQVSGYGYTVYERCEGFQEWGWKAGGYATLLDLLMKKIPDASNELSVGDKIHHQAEVVQILWDDNDEVVVKLRSGGMFIAEHVVMTVSLGVLKTNSHLMFKPALPQHKLNSIQ
ncbi:hypothetical protein L9F63_002605, partial [Diploptera punctata]